MHAMIDEIIWLNETGMELKFKSWQRESAEKSVAGLDGVLSIDLGSRKRTVIQTGILRSPSSQALAKKINTINNLQDGLCHTLVMSSGITYSDLRVDSFETFNRTTGSSGVCCNYKLVYTQLGI